MKANRGFFRRLARHTSFRQALDAYRERWSGLGLAITPALVGRSWLIAAAVIALGLLLAGGRIADALSHGRHNIGFILLLALIGVIAAVKMIPQGRVTAAGKRFLHEVRLAHDLGVGSANPRPAQRQRGAADIALLAVAVIGFDALVGTTWFSLREAFTHSTTPGGGGCSSGSACGTSSSSSDSGGGSGCGGGGCGGGGGD